MSRYNNRDNYSTNNYNNDNENNINNDNSNNDISSSPSSSLEVKYNSSGYRQYKNESTGKWEYTHRTVAEKKVGRPLQSDEHAHHINKNKTDNRYSNIVVLKENIHRHKSEQNERNCCFRCGRIGHWVQDCYEKTDIDGNEL